MECCRERPNRSDIHLSVEEEAKLEAKARGGDSLDQIGKI